MWKKFSKADQSGLAIIRDEAHHAAQIIASFSRSFLPAIEEDTNAVLQWDTNNLLMKTKYFGPMKNVQLGLNIRQFQIELLVEDLLFDSVMLTGKTAEFIQEWIIYKLNGLQIKTDNYSDELPYQLEAINFDKEHEYHANNQDDQILLTSLYHNSQLALKKVIEARNFTHAQVNIWPHHFDMAFSMRGRNDSHLTVGFSPGDQHISSPYFYISIWPKTEESRLSGIKPIVGQWQLNGWQGLVLLMNDFVLENEYLEERIILDFLKNGIQLINKVAT